jgi:hypothetical protein
VSSKLRAPWTDPLPVDPVTFTGDLLGEPLDMRRLLDMPVDGLANHNENLQHNLLTVLTAYLGLALVLNVRASS